MISATSLMATQLVPQHVISSTELSPIFPTSKPLHMGTRYIYKKDCIDQLRLEFAQSMIKLYLVGCLVLLGLNRARGANTTVGKFIVLFHCSPNIIYSWCQNN